MEKETNLEHYLKRLKRIVKEQYNSPMMIFESIQEYIDPEIKKNHVEYTSNILEWMAQEYKEEILDYVEKKYLSEVIRPFRKKVTTIKKVEAPAGGRIYFNTFKRRRYVSPCLKKDTMYKGMKLEKRYTPEELGL